MEKVKVIGAGLAGCEAAWQLAKRGIQVDLYEMKLTTIYPQQAIGVVDDGFSMVISYNETDFVFEIPIKAEILLKKLRKELHTDES